MDFYSFQEQLNPGVIIKDNKHIKYNSQIGAYIV